MKIIVRATIVVLLLGGLGSSAFGANWKQITDTMSVDKASIKMKREGVYKAKINLSGLIIPVEADCRKATLNIDGIVENINSSAGSADKEVWGELCHNYKR